MSKAGFRVRWGFFLALGLGGAACGIGTEQALQDSSPYFDIPGLLAQQAQHLGGSQQLCQKYMRLGTTEETHFLSQDSSAWMRSWGHLLALDLNKPALRGTYDSIRTQEGMHSVLRYSPKATPSEGLLQKMALSWDSTGTLVAIEAHFSEQRYLYNQAGRLWLRLVGRAAAPRLVYYELRGYQQLRTQDTLQYHIIWECS